MINDIFVLFVIIKYNILIILLMEEKDKHEVEISQKALRNRNKAKKANFFS